MSHIFKKSHLELKVQQPEVLLPVHSPLALISQACCWVKTPAMNALPSLEPQDPPFSGQYCEVWH